MKGIILAAGQGSRLRPLTDDRPKCLVTLAGRTLLDYQVSALRAAGVEEIIVVTGYRADQIEALSGPARLATRHNPAYDRTNMVASLMCAADALMAGDDVIISYGDIVYLPGIVKNLLAAGDEFATTVDRNWLDLWRLRNEDPLADAETLRLDPTGAILSLGERPASLVEIEAQYMGLIYLSGQMATAAVRSWRSLATTTELDERAIANLYMTSFLQHLIDSGHRLQAVPIHGGWLEVDTVADLTLYADLEGRGQLAEAIGLRLGACA